MPGREAINRGYSKKLVKFRQINAQNPLHKDNLHFFKLLRQPTPATGNTKRNYDRYWRST